MMIITWYFVIVLLPCLRVVPAGAITRLTNFTFVLELLTWNDARKACNQMGGHLVEIQDETKDNAVLHVIDTYYDHLESGKYGVAIGLANLTVGRQDFYWEHSCEPMAWSNWGPNQNEKRLCVKIEADKRVWSRGACQFPRSFICEQTSDEPCPYHKQDFTTLSALAVVNITFNNITQEECLGLCDTERSDGMDCWAINAPNLSNTTRCVLFFTKDPYLLTNSSYQMSSTYWDLYTKHCFRSNVVMTYNFSRSDPGANVPEFECEEVTGSSTIFTSSASTKTSTPGENEVTILITDVSQNPKLTIPITKTPTRSGDNGSTMLTTEMSETPVLTIPATKTSTPSTESSKTTFTTWISQTQTVTNRFRITSTLSEDSKATLLPTEIIQNANQTIPETSYTTYSGNNSQSIYITEVDQSEPPSTQTDTTPYGDNGQAILTTEFSPNPIRATPTPNVSSSDTDSGVARMTTTLSQYVRDISSVSNTATTEVYYQLCSCPCHVAWSLQKKRRVMEELLRNLTLNKTELSSFRRKYYSVLDERPLSVGIGCTGVLSISVFISLIVMCDVTNIKKHAKEAI